ncbi:MAG: hypothetical protein ACKVQC_03595 [Elusimicrobiota bacterium]
MTTISYILFIFFASFVWAKMEIEIEGKDGWAANLPTWRVEKHPLLDWLYGGRPLTGYHVWAFTFVFGMFHLPFVWNGYWSVRQELNVIGAYDLFWVSEDFLWFVLNPHYGWKKFNRENVWWHKRWFLGFPLDYWMLSLFGFILLFGI